MNAIPQPLPEDFDRDLKRDYSETLIYYQGSAQMSHTVHVVLPAYIRLLTAERAENQRLREMLAKMPTQVEPGQLCQYEGCAEPATDIAQGRECYGSKGHPKIAAYCRVHADEVIDEGNPEYHERCPNCGLRFGVN